MPNTHLWHPCTRLQDLEKYPPLRVKAAQGCYFELTDGRKVIDGISSWWCKNLGHGHPQLKQALQRQSECFEHTILANTTNDVIEELSAKLATLSPGLDKVFYASDGSCAIDAAVKMSLHSRIIDGEPQRRGFMTLSNSYHGETGIALSVSDVGIYRQPYEPLLFDVPIIEDIPYVSDINDPLWRDCSTHWPAIEEQLAPYADTLSAIIVEPILQGAAGMLIYSQDFLARLRHWTQQHGVHLIADEIMTGFGRTGTALACQHASIQPDFICLGKGLTSGWLPLSAVVTSSTIYQKFYSDPVTGQHFLHSHTFSGNALAASVALACLNVLKEDNIYQRVDRMAMKLRHAMDHIADETGQLTAIRHIGAVVAADLKPQPQKPRAAFEVCQQATQLGAFLRPLGNTIYWFPPLNADDEVIESLHDMTLEAIETTL